MLTFLSFQVMSLFCSVFRSLRMKILKKKIKIATKIEIEKKKSFILFQEASWDKNLLNTLKLKFNCRRFDFHNLTNF